MTTRLLSPEDIYDVYGCEWILLASDIDIEDKQFLSFRLNEIQNAYVHACKSRIRAEAEFLGIKGVGELSFSSMLTEIRNQLGKVVQDSMMEQSERMMRGGPPKIFGDIIKAHMAAGNVPKGVDLSKLGIVAEASKPRPDVDPDWFMNTKREGRLIHDPKWAEITKAYLEVESATTPQKIVIAIDRLNQLQHNSFHVLIDLQTGRMLNDFDNATGDRDARKNLQEILDIKLKSRSPAIFINRMSSGVQDLLRKYRGATIRITDE